ncbi:type 2 lanthipeptide synthetase LanM family protein [Haladaptatus cibarius]|uniref:type 2 lanthipeptide synthetase LanM family protein n=1 Tax=Haladaptatus cibarius TaxID=453847 RepID=UPI0006791192|nr:type 2 lanthipeptide synthetase LanM family protein [Haladaptatus cibarius]
MSLTTEEKKRVAVRAKTLHDRLRTSSDDLSREVVENPDDWMDEWRARVADGEEDPFQKRLEIAGLSVAECRRRIQMTDWSDDDALPAWVDQLDELLLFVEATDVASVDDPLRTDDVPFAHFLNVLVEYASEKVDWRETPEPAVDAFKRWLLDRFHTIFAHPLFIEFKGFIAARDPELAVAENPDRPSSPRKYYDSFTETLTQGGLRSFCIEYAVLSKLLITFVRQWIDAVESFSSHLAADRTALNETFGSDGDLGPVTDIDFLGDPHQGGKTVLGVTFESGTKTAYKPRDMRIDTAFYDFLEWVNDAADLPNVRTLTCLPRETYGWQEWVESDSCSAQSEVDDYYRRSGMLLAILYALNFTDGHLENIVAVGDQPVVVDLETVLEPVLAADKRTAGNEMYDLVHGSLLRMRVLPMYLPSSDIQRIDGLGAEEGEATGVEIPEFSDVNTDIMELDYRDTRTIEGESLPLLDGDRITPENHADPLIGGFEEMYRFFLDNRAEILAEDGPIALFEGTEVRFLYRSTKIYGRTLVPATTPAYLRTGLKFGCKVELLARPFTEETVGEEMWDVYEAERTAMWRFDIPRFTVNATDTKLRHDGQAVKDVFETTPIEQVRDRINEFGESDLRNQLDYFKLAYAEEEISHPTPPRSQTETGDETDGRTTPASADLFRRRSREIFDRIRNHKRTTPYDSVTWHLREHRNGGIYFHRLIEDLYEGRIGIAVFSAALANVTGEDEYRQFTADVVAPLIDRLDVEKGNPFSDDRVGAGHGIGSLIYGCTKVGQLLSDDEYIRTAEEIAAILTPERIEEDELFDALGGTAGVILGLLALYEETGDEAVLERATIAGDHLCSNRIEEDGVLVWHTINNVQALTGFSHGIAGIAYSLFKLADASGHSRFRDAAVEGIRFERESFSPERNNWPDRRLLTDTDFVTGWCSGRAGIGLARLGMFEIEPNAEPDSGFRQEVEHALRGTDPTTLVDRDHVCCGNFGRVEFLLRAGRTLDEEQYRESARALAGSAVQRAETIGQYTVPWQTEDWYNPTFFLGESGIGYSLLRLDNPELPCVMLWE